MHALSFPFESRVAVFAKTYRRSAHEKRSAGDRGPPQREYSYFAFFASFAPDGSNVTVLPSGFSVTLVTRTDAPVLVLSRVTVESESVFESIGSEKVAVTSVLRSSFRAPSAGYTLATVGAAVSTLIVRALDSPEVLPAVPVALAL